MIFNVHFAAAYGTDAYGSQQYNSSTSATTPSTSAPGATVTPVTSGALTNTGAGIAIAVVLAAL